MQQRNEIAGFPPLFGDGEDWLREIWRELWRNSAALALCGGVAAACWLAISV
jgi:hypothetical protein